MKIIEANYHSAMVELTSEDCFVLGRALVLAGDTAEAGNHGFSLAEVMLCHACGAAIEAAGILSVAQSHIASPPQGFGLAYLRQEEAGARADADEIARSDKDGAK